MAAPRRSDIVFLDIEASGLSEDSFPIEVGWAFLDGSSGAMLIRPAADWDLGVWDDQAEALHGISICQLLRDGVQARDVAEHLNQVLAPSHGPLTVLSDAPEQDSFWLRRLFDETPEAQLFELQNESRARPAGMPHPYAIGHTRAHRAEADAAAYVSVWRSLNRT